MSLWIIFSVLPTALFGIVVWSAAMVTAGQTHRLGVEGSEPRAWWRLTWPLFAGVLVVAFLIGWALQEPDPADEWAAFELCALAFVVSAFLVRAVVRAFRALRVARDVCTPVATVGLFRCRTIVSESFERTASTEALDAALAHEAAHARSRDPLRIWVAQFAADLQWPIPSARRRFRDWILALEIRRDDEVVRAGVEPAALAESILLAAKLHSAPANLPNAAVTGTGPGAGLALRVRRLLSNDVIPQRAQMKRPYYERIACHGLVMASVACLGFMYGEFLLRLLPGVVQ